MDLTAIGATPDLLDRRAPLRDAGLTLGRVCSEHRETYDVLTEDGQVLARLPGRYRHKVRSAVDRPAVGDWVTLYAPPGGGSAVIQEFLPRRNEFVRKAAGPRTAAQMLATNLDVIFVLSNQQVPLPRQAIERYLSLIQGLDVQPVLLLNKSELVEDPRRAADELGLILPGLKIHVISALGSQGAHIEDGADVVRHYLAGRLSAAVLGTSGAGKSTLVNRLMGTEAMATQAVREADFQGRHTTVHRQLMAVPTGGVIIDTPGMRGLQPWDEEAGVQVNFADIEDLALECKYRNCSHGGEQACAVQAAVEAGTLAAERLEDYTQLAREALELERKKRDQAHSDNKKRLKRANRTARMNAEARETRRNE